MALLGKEQILAADDVRFEDVPVPEWGGEVRVRGLTGVDRDLWEASMMERRGKQMIPNTYNARAKLLALCIIDEDGGTIFTAADVKDLGSKSGAALERVYDAAAKLSGVKESDYEEAVQDFTATPGGPASSG